MTIEELDARNEARFAAMAASFTKSMEVLAAAQIEAQRMADAAPRERMRQNLIAGCYQIRLRAYCENYNKSHGVGFAADPDPKMIARQAANDADAVLAMVGP